MPGQPSNSGRLLSGRAGGSPAMESTLVKESFGVVGAGRLHSRLHSP
jgi:hypothetical protein